MMETNKVEKESGQFDSSKQLQQRTVNVYRISVLLLLLLILAVLMYTASVIITNYANWQCTCNCTEVCRNDSRLHSGLLAQEDRQVATPLERSWITELDYYNSTVMPVIIIIPNFTKVITNKDIWMSDPFLAFEGGYQMFIRVNTDDTNSYVSVYLYLMKGPNDDELQQSGFWPMKGTFIIELLNQKEDNNHHKKVYFLSNETCSECANRVIDKLVATGYGTHKFMLQSSLIGSIRYYKNHSIYIRISYGICYACAFVKEALISALLLFFFLIQIDNASGLTLLEFVLLYKNLKETSKLVFGIQFDYEMVKRIVYKDTIKTCFLMGLLVLASELLPALLMEFVSLDASYVSVRVINRLLEVCTYSLTVSIYSYGNKQFAIVKPIWLLYLFHQTYSFLTTCIFVLSLTFINIFFVNIYNVLEL